jgi:hypothetical protein
MPSYAYPTETTVTEETTVLHSWTNLSCGESGILTTTPSTVTRAFAQRSAIGWHTPGWRKMRNSGAILPMTRWYRTEVDAEVTSSERYWCDVNNRKKKYVNYWRSWPDLQLMQASWFRDRMDEPDLEYFVQQAAAAIYSKGWDAGTFLAEIGQLRRMLSGVGKKIDDLSRGRLPDELHNLWLEGRYGWRTLMYDIQDLREVLSSTNERRSRYREQKGATLTGTYNDSLSSSSSGITVLDEYDISYTVNARGVVIADIDVPDFQFNPITTAWEVTRLSFVVDWLLNVGQALEAASFTLMAKDYKACGGFKADFSLTGQSRLTSKGTNVSATHNADWNASATIISREPMSVSSLPRMKLRLNEWKVIDLLALVRQRLR